LPPLSIAIQRHDNLPSSQHADELISSLVRAVLALCQVRGKQLLNKLEAVACIEVRKYMVEAGGRESEEDGGEGTTCFGAVESELGFLLWPSEHVQRFLRGEPFLDAYACDSVPLIVKLGGQSIREADREGSDVCKVARGKRRRPSLGRRRRLEGGKEGG
jgi:hypothetical protein